MMKLVASVELAQKNKVIYYGFITLANAHKSQVN